jgi:hypothetical protein
LALPFELKLIVASGPDAQVPKSMGAWDRHGLGRTFFRDNEIVVNVTTGSSKDYDEAMCGHEYFHIILHNKGFVSKTWVPPFHQLEDLTPEASPDVLTNLQINIPSCFLDELIDRETSKRGLKPEVINERSERSTIRSAERAALAPAPALRTQPTVQKAMALGLFCLAIRKSSRREINVPWLSFRKTAWD